MLRVHVLPVFADQAIAAIQPGDVRRFIADKVASGAAPGTVHSIGRSSGSSSQPHRPKAPSEPSPVTGSGSRPRPRRTWSSSAPIRSRTSPPRSTPRYATLIRLAAYTGLRAGEIGALRIGRVDLDARRLTIAESVTEVQGHGLVFGEPKTYERRSVTLPGFLRGDLATHLHHRDADPKAFVFTSPDGAVLNHKNFYRRTFKPAVRTAGLPDRARFHDLRHTCAALCIALGAHPKAIQERLGHSSITVTLDRYGHLFPKLDETLTTRLDDLRRNATGGPAANAIP
jgi:integrase